MTDLLARLRAVNPVRTCTPPIIGDVWRKLEHQDQAPDWNAPRQKQRGPIRRFSWARLRIRHVGVGLAIVVPVFVAVFAVVLLGHNQNHRLASLTRPPLQRPAAPRPARTDARSPSIVAALAHGVHPLAPHARMQLPLLGSSGTRSLHSFRGKIVVLNVFASWCRLCRNTATTLERAQTHIVAQQATVLGVNFDDTVAAAHAFVRARHITYPVLRDITGQFVFSFGIKGVPETFVIDRHGRIVAARVGPVSRRWLGQTLARVLPGSTGSP